jgi:hypothetical protein
LILMGFGLSVAPVRIFADFLATVPSYTATSWVRLTTPGLADYHPLWAPTLLFELAGNIAMIVFAVLLVWAFFRRKRAFPALYILVSAAALLFRELDDLLANAIPTVQQTAEAPSPADAVARFMTVVWGIYVLRSQRVRRTFVN